LKFETDSMAEAVGSSESRKPAPSRFRFYVL